MQEIKKDEPSYYAIIPANIRYDNNLNANSKLLYGEITCLCNKDGNCWATNEYFAKLYSVSNVSISNWISLLVKQNYIKRVLVYKNGTKEILNRYLSLIVYPIKENFNTPIKENFKDNTTSINITSINKEIYKENSFEELNNWNKEKNNRVVVPTLQQVQEYVKDKTLNVDANKFFNYYNDADWTDKENKKIKNWKLKCNQWNLHNQSNTVVNKNSAEFLLKSLGCNQ